MSGNAPMGRPQPQVGCSTVPCCTHVAVHAPGVTCTFIRRRQCTHHRGGSSSARRAHRAWSPSLDGRAALPAPQPGRAGPRDRPHGILTEHEHHRVRTSR